MGNTLVGDRINFATGNLFTAEIDYSTAGSFPLVLARYYNSKGGGGWRVSYSRSIALLDAGRTAVVTRDDGRALTFTRYIWNSIAGPWTGPVYSSYRLSGGVFNDFTLVTDRDETETYNYEGKLLAYANRAGLTQTIGYDGLGRLSTVTRLFLSLSALRRPTAASTNTDITFSRV